MLGHMMAVTPPHHTRVMTSRRRPRTHPSFGRFTPPGIVAPTPPRQRVPDCICCAAEARGEPVPEQAIWANTLRLIEQHGHALQYVHGERGRPSWAYSIGRLSHGLPELIIVGEDPHTSSHAISHVALLWPRLDDLDEVIPAEVVGLSRDVRLLPVPERLWTASDWFLGAERYRRLFVPDGPRDALQIVVADASGRFPWDPDAVRSLGRRQPILGLQPV